MTNPFSSLFLLTYLQGQATHSPTSNWSTFAEPYLSFCSAKSASLEHFLEAPLHEGPRKGLGQVCSVLLSRQEGGFSSTSSLASYFAAAAPRGGYWIFCLIKLSSNILWSQCVARPWQPVGLLHIPRGRGQLGGLTSPLPSG